MPSPLHPAPAPVVLIGGPTASGKSALALAVAEAFGGTVINADSMQVYRDLRILTARPGPAEEARAPHRLYGVLDAAEPCSAARWRDLAEAEIARAAAGGRLPVLVGGTGLYFQALTQGLASIPAIPPEVRAAARRLHDELGGVAFRARLADHDPQGAARLFPGDSQRLLRAYEVVVATGRPLHAWQRMAGEMPPQRPVAGIVVLPPRAALYAACEARLAAMVEAGVLNEVAALLARRLDPALPAMKAVGLREFARCLAGAIPLAEAMRLAAQATRNYAKRQVTWFRHRAGPALRIEAQFSEKNRSEIFAFIRQFLLTGPARADTVQPR